MSEKNKFESSEPTDRWDAFEDQLSRLVPTPPMMDWEAVADSISNVDSAVAVDSTSDRSAGRRMPFVSHALATMVGVAIGATVMLLMQPAVGPASNNDLETLAKESTDPAVAVVKQSKPNDIPQTSDPASVQPRWRRDYLDRLRGEQVTRVWPANFDLADVALSRQFYQPGESFDVPGDGLETSNSNSESEDDFDQPLTAPQLMRKMLNEQSLRSKHSKDHDSESRAA